VYVRDGNLWKSQELEEPVWVHLFPKLDVTFITRLLTYLGILLLLDGCKFLLSLANFFITN